MWRRKRQTIGSKICLTALSAAILTSCVPSGQIYNMASQEYGTQTEAGKIEDILKETSDSRPLDTLSKNGIPSQLIKKAVYTDEIIGMAESIHYLDVGDGLCCICMDKGHLILVGTGSEEYRDKVMYYIDRLSPNLIDIVLPGMTEDIAGNAADIVNRYHNLIGNIIIPPYNSTKEDEGNRLIDAVDKNELYVVTPDDAKMVNINGITGVVYRPYTSSPGSHEEAETIFVLYSGKEQFVFEGRSSGKKEDEVIQYHSFDRTTPIAVIYKMAADGTWTERFSTKYYITSGEGEEVWKVMTQRGVNYIDAASKGTVVFSYGDLGMTIKTNVPDTDNASDYNEKETSEPEFVDAQVVIDDNGVIHQNINCLNFKGDVIRECSLSDALALGKRLCERCMDEETAEKYKNWSEYHTQENIIVD